MVSTLLADALDDVERESGLRVTVFLLSISDYQYDHRGNRPWDFQFYAGPVGLSGAGTDGNAAGTERGYLRLLFFLRTGGAYDLLCCSGDVTVLVREKR